MLLDRVRLPKLPSRLLRTPEWESLRVVEEYDAAPLADSFADAKAGAEAQVRDAVEARRRPGFHVSDRV
jgi:hypothetical protein